MTDLDPVTAGEAAPDSPPSVSDAWRELWALACEMRADWDPVDWQGAVLACRHSGVPFAEAGPVVWRLAWDTSATSDLGTAEIRDLARARRPVPTSPGVYARGGALWREMYEHRTKVTGGQPVLREDDGPA